MCANEPPFCSWWCQNVVGLVIQNKNILKTMSIYTHLMDMSKGLAFSCFCLQAHQILAIEKTIRRLMHCLSVTLV